MTDGGAKLTILERRRIEAEVLKHVYEVLERELGKERAQDLLGTAIREAGLQSGRALADEVNGQTSLRTFAAVFERWKEGDAYDMDVLAQDDVNFDFNITRCKYAEMYKEIGLAHVGHLLSCGRDGSLCEGYDSRIKMRRTQTIMGGSTHCDFRFSYSGEKKD